MQLTLRSQLIAGVAALGVSAVAVVPVAQPELMTAAQRVSSAVNLTSFANPVTVLLATIDEAVYSTFDQAELPPPSDLFWPDSFYDDLTLDAPFLWSPQYEGLIPDFLNQVGNGAISAVGNNLSGYVSALGYGINQLISGPADAIWNTPFALVTAAGYVLAGRVDLALAELQNQIIEPLVSGISGALQAVGYLIDNPIANVATLVSSSVPLLLSNLIGTVVGGIGYVGASAIGTLGAIVAEASALNIEGAWNAAIDGFLGPDGTLGQLVQLTGGIGIVEDVDYDGDVVPTVTTPSFRSDLTTFGQRLGDFRSFGYGGIRNDPFEPVLSAAAVAAPAASEAQVATPAAEAATPAAEAASADVTRPVAGEAADVSADASTPAAAPTADAATGDNDAPAAAEKPATSKHKVTRKARTAS